MSKGHYEKASVVIKALVQGTDPETGEPFPPDSVLNRSDVLRALLTASVAIENMMSRAARRAQLPSNVGRSWERTRRTHSLPLSSPATPSRPLPLGTAEPFEPSKPDWRNWV